MLPLMMHLYAGMLGRRCGAPLQSAHRSEIANHLTYVTNWR